MMELCLVEKSCIYTELALLESVNFYNINFNYVFSKYNIAYKLLCLLKIKTTNLNSFHSIFPYIDK